MANFKEAQEALATGRAISRESWEGEKALHEARDGIHVVGIGVPANTTWKATAADLAATDWKIS